MVQLAEPILDENSFRFTAKPISPQYELFWKIYKMQQESYWKAEEIDFSKDYDHFKMLNEDEQHFIKTILAFFASSDGIVNLNLRERFLQEIKVPEAQFAYSFQLMMENIHSEVYADMLMNIVRDDKERIHLLDAINTIPSVKRFSDYAIRWIRSDQPIQYRIVAFAIVEGVFFSGAFASIFWIKYHKNITNNFMNGLMKSNRFIARDEGLHCNFACLLYGRLKNRLNNNDLNNMFIEAVDIAIDLINESLRCDLIGMNRDLMAQYIRYVADRLIIFLGGNKLFNTTNPFDFMESIGLLSKDNFFEMRPDAYQSAYNDKNKDWTFKILDDY